MLSVAVAALVVAGLGGSPASAAGPTADRAMPLHRAKTSGSGMHKPTRSRLAATAASTSTTLGLNVWDTKSLRAAESTLGFRAGIVGVFVDWVHDPAFPVERARQATADGATLMISWEPWDSWTAETSQEEFQAADISRGAHDALIDDWAEAVRSFGRKVLIRFAPEMNGDWRPWSAGVNGNTPADYVAAWRHVVDRFRRAGASNAQWVWNPYVAVGESTPMRDLFPGGSYVDVLALDGYNWGSTRIWGWQDYDDIFATSIPALRGLAPGKPWIMAEIGCAPGPQKPAWITDTLTRARQDGARAVVWFEFVKETDWRLSSNRKTVGAARSILREPGWLAGGPVSAQRERGGL